MSAERVERRPLLKMSELAERSGVSPGTIRYYLREGLLGEGADVGIGASVTQGNTIGAWSIVGAGAVVIGDVDADTTVVGCPSRVVDTRPSGWPE